MGSDMRDLERFMNELPDKLRKAVGLFLEKTGAVGVSKISETFKTQGRNLGLDWKPVNPRYLQWKLRKGFSEKTLHRTTTLAQSFTYRTTPQSVEIGTPVRYGIYHEYGTERMPARPFLKPVGQWLAQKQVSKLFRSAFEEAV